MIIVWQDKMYVTDNKLDSKKMVSEDKFVYSSRYPPLFFCRPSSNEEADEWVKATNSVIKEYFVLSKDESTDSNTTLSNGMTCAELAIYYIRSTHKKRAV